MNRSSLSGYQGSPLLIPYLDHTFRPCDSFEVLILEGRTFRRIEFLEGWIHSKESLLNQWFSKDSVLMTAFCWPIDFPMSDCISSKRLGRMDKADGSWSRGRTFETRKRRKYIYQCLMDTFLMHPWIVCLWIDYKSMIVGCKISIQTNKQTIMSVFATKAQFHQYLRISQGVFCFRGRVDSSRSEGPGFDSHVRRKLLPKSLMDVGG